MSASTASSEPVAKSKIEAIEFANFARAQGIGYILVANREIIFDLTQDPKTEYCVMGTPPVKVFVVGTKEEIEKKEKHDVYIDPLGAMPSSAFEKG